MKQSTSFVVRVNDIVPKSATLQTPIAAAYMGVSLNNPAFTGKRLVALLDWIADNAVTCRLMIGQDVSRWTYMVQRGISESEARVIAARHGRKLRAVVTKAIQGSTRPSAFWLHSDSDLQGHPRFTTALAELVALESASPLFYDLVTQSALDYCDRQQTRRSLAAVNLNTAVNLSRRFILEELALFCVLVADGFPVELYPGAELPVLSAIANGQLHNAPAELVRRINLVLAVDPAISDESSS